MSGCAHFCNHPQLSVASQKPASIPVRHDTAESAGVRFLMRLHGPSSSRVVAPPLPTVSDSFTGFAVSSRRWRENVAHHGRDWAPGLGEEFAHFAPIPLAPWNCKEAWETLFSSVPRRQRKWGLSACYSPGPWLLLRVLPWHSVSNRSLHLGSGNRFLSYLDLLVVLFLHFTCHLDYLCS